MGSAQGRVIRVSGSIVVASGLEGTSLYNRVGVGELGLSGEVVRVEAGRATVQVYEATAGLRIDEPVTDTGAPFTATLGPGLLGSTFDGIQRPLPRLAEREGPFVGRGVCLDHSADSRVWEFEPLVRAGDRVVPGQVLGHVQENPGFRHRILCPPGSGGMATVVHGGSRRLGEAVCTLEGGEALRLGHAWPCRASRPYRRKLGPERPAITGQRVLDCLFPLAEGGVAIIPGGFGTGKTILEHCLAKFLDSDVVVYVGCGERGNEMADILRQFSALEDPHTGRPLIERTVLIANTSNMPVAAREASIYTGITLGEYFRDQGLRVTLLADSVSRWAEALREISSRLEELPGEEGYPPYLASRLGQFYERAGRVECLTGGRTGSLSVVAAISPPGGDFSEPVTQGSLRVTGCFWALDPALASRRHYPAVGWTESFSLYRDSLAAAWAGLAGERFGERTRWIGEVLVEEQKVRDIASLVGYDALQDAEKFILKAGLYVREGFLQQDAYDAVDVYCSPRKTALLLEIFVSFLSGAREVLRRTQDLGQLERLGADQLLRLRYLSEERLEAVLREVEEHGTLALD